MAAKALPEERLETLGDGVVLINRDLRIVSWSLSAERITGYPQEEVVGRECREVLGSALCEKGCPVGQTVNTGEVVSNISTEIETASGVSIPVSINTTPLKDPRGEIIGAVVTFRNIAEIETLTYELRKEKNMLKAIVESIADGVFTVDADWKITSFNKAAERITGFSREEATGIACHHVFRSEVCKEGCPLRKTMETGDPVSDFEMEVLRKDGRKVPISVNTALLIDEEGEIAGGVETFRDLSEMKRLSSELSEKYSFTGIIGKNPKMQELYDLLKTVSETSSTVLVQGETGTGKELVARAIHYNSPRHERPFIAVSCAALPETLLESELFGHMRGAFTGAIKDKPGRFELANGGSLFLDEVGEIPPPVQVKLLRVLEKQEFERLGGTRTLKVDVRVIAATNKDLKELMERAQFREDLYYRLNVVPIHLPPLRERSDDIPLLVKHFVEEFNRKTGKRITAVAPEVMDILIDHLWPGNVRQLENAIEHAFVHCRGEVIQLRHLPEELKALEKAVADEAPATSLSEFEKRAIVEALKRNRWNRENTARELKISRTTLWRKMKRYGIQRP